MRFLLRTAFWFTVVLMIWPDGGENQGHVRKAVQDSASSLTSSLTTERVIGAAVAVKPLAEAVQDRLTLRPSLDSHSADHAVFMPPLPAPRPAQ
jgi:hypothetical protein